MDIQINKDMLPEHLKEMFDGEVVLDTPYQDMDPAVADALGNPIERDIDQMRMEYALKKALHTMTPQKPKRKQKKTHSVIDELKKL